MQHCLQGVETERLQFYKVWARDGIGDIGNHHGSFEELQTFYEA